KERPWMVQAWVLPGEAGFVRAKPTEAIGTPGTAKEFSSSLGGRRIGQNVNGVQPCLHSLGPRSHGECGSTQTVTVAALGINVQFRGHPGILQSKEINNSVLYMNRIVLRLHQE